MTARLHHSILVLALIGTAPISFVACGGTPTDGTAIPSAGGNGSIEPVDSGASSSETPDGSASGSAPDSSIAPPPPGKDASAPPPEDASSAPDTSVPPGDPVDGTPNPQACTSGHGAAITKKFGRLDGFLDSKQCGTVDDHLDIQIRMGGAAYDCAINLDTLYVTKDGKMPDMAWSEGWHPGLKSDYTTTFGLHDTDFTQPATMSDLGTILETAMANANHISVYATGYGPDGIHDVHYKSGNSDGIIVIDPLSPTAHMFMFRFSTDSF